MYIVFSIPCFRLNSVFRLKSFNFAPLQSLVSKWSSPGCYKAEMGVLLAHRMSVSLPHGLIVKNLYCVGIIGKLPTFFVCADVAH